MHTTSQPHNSLATFKEPKALVAPVLLIIKTFVGLTLVTLVFCVAAPRKVLAQADTWTTRAPLSGLRYEMGTAVINGKLYIVGGGDGLFRSRLEVYDPATNSWQVKAPMRSPRFGLVAAAIDGKLYAAGGISSNFVPALEVYDPATNTWQTKAPMPSGRYLAAGAAIDGKLYVVGGNSPEGAAGRSKLQVYDPATNMWEIKAPMPTGRENMVAAAINGKLYVVGGQGSFSNVFSIVEAYDPITNSWETKTPMPDVRYYHAGAVIGTKLYIMGGWNANSMLASLAVYDAITDSWQTKAPMPAARYAHGAAAIDNTVYVFGGVRPAGQTVIVDAYLAIVANTGGGSGVSVQPVDSTTGNPAPITLSFSAVTAAGNTTVTSISSNLGAPLPNRFKVGQPPTYYDINTTAQFTPPVTLCVQYPDTAYQHNESNLKLMHFNGTVWEDITSSLNTSTNTICGISSSLSPFVIAEEDQAPVLTVPSAITAEATSNAGTAVSFTTNAADDFDSSVLVNCDHQSGETFQLGTTTVHCSATDTVDNNSHKNFDITVRDTTPPALTLPGDQVLLATSASGAIATFSASASDLVDGPVTPQCTPASGSVFAPGTTTVTCNATDAHTNSKSETFNVRVNYDFTGFFQPVDNDLTIYNVMKAGRAVPVKFRLGGDVGLSVFAVGYPASAPIACSSSAPVDAVEETLAAGGSSLSYDTASGQYNFVWKTEASWANSCRQLVVQYRDGSIKRANFKFTK